MHSSPQLGNDLSFGFIDRSLPSSRNHHPVLISNEDENTMLRALREEIRSAKHFVFSVAFVSPDAIALLKEALYQTPAHGTIITSDYLGFNSPAAFRELLHLGETTGISIRRYSRPKSGFHAKGYLFTKDATLTAIVGSSNLTANALLRNKEWNLKFSALPGGDIVNQIDREIRTQEQHSIALTSEWIDQYERTYVVRTPALSPQGSVLPPEAFDSEPPATDLAHYAPPLGSAFGTAFSTTPGELFDIDSDAFHTTRTAHRAHRIVPNQMQAEALEALQRLRESGNQKGLIISATGTGKTILSALDVRILQPERLLFIVHREQILDRAIFEYSRVLEAPPSSFGKLTGSIKQLDAKYLFVTVQSLQKAETLAQLAPDAFDYILIDEVHKAGAVSYRKILEHFEPKFLLGMTATPERSDGQNIFELFDFNVPYEIRLQRALEEEMLAPFHYYGVTDYVDADGTVIDDTASLSKLVSAERVDHLLKAIKKYGHVGVPVRGLMFCSKKDEAHQLSSLLNQHSLKDRPLRTRALTGDDSIEMREAVVRELESGLLDYIITVDIFNEGIDIPSVNQVVMLRQTASSIIFTQQLGRGLRKAAGKDYLVVIDFIGNYANNFLVPIALFGDRSLNKDSIRQKMIESEEAGHIAGVSSVHFDEISRERVFRSLAVAKIDTVVALKKQIQDLEYRLNRIPMLLDFALSDTVDPVVIGTKEGNYWSLLKRARFAVGEVTPLEECFLTFATTELLNGKRPHELVLLRELLDGSPLTDKEIQLLFVSKGLTSDQATIESVLRVLTLEFYTQVERTKYGDPPVLRDTDNTYRLSPSASASLVSNETFRTFVQDAVETGLHLARHQYVWGTLMEVGKRYSRKDVCRLLNWQSNQQSTMYGYKLDTSTRTLPIFITYHKDDDITSSVKYDEGFTGPSQLRWASKANRTLQSNEIQQILEQDYDLHVFVKKDDADGLDFFYLGEGKIHSPVETTQKNKEGKSIPIVEMTVDLASPVETALYDYFLTTITSSSS